MFHQFQWTRSWWEQKTIKKPNQYQRSICSSCESGFLKREEEQSKPVHFNRFLYLAGGTTGTDGTLLFYIVFSVPLRGSLGEATGTF